MQILWDDGERTFSRQLRSGVDGKCSVLVARPAGEQPRSGCLGRLAHEFGLKDELDSTWSVRPLEMLREGAQMHLVLEDPGGVPLMQLLIAPMETATFLRLAVGIAVALGKLHQQGLVHKDIKPSHILVNCTDGQARLTGFGLASRLPRERQAPETLAGTLAYMAPEQTGRMNRSIDSRSDLYSFGVTLYQMLTGSLPFTASDPIEWVHCHIARMTLPPHERVATVPEMLSLIVMKLLAKTAEERYQTAASVEHDLRRCLADWQQQGRIDAFALGEHGASDRLLIPEKLYGREREVDTLVAAFSRIVQSSSPELVLVTGYSGIGKSSVVNELHKALVPPRGLFASGKFDQYRRDIPYSTLVQAFQSLVRTLLGKSDAELTTWRDALQEALDVNARLMTDLIPELKLIIGEPPPVTSLDPQQEQRRFLLVFRRFIGVFAREDHPLALFLDDLQWLDAATLDLLEDLLTSSDVRHLMLVGAYRSNEVDISHPLTAKLQAIRSAGGKVSEITLTPLAKAHVELLIAEALQDERSRIEPLAQLVLDKTAGNPFFVIQFLHALAEEHLLTFDHEARQWWWDPDRIHAKGYTDNIVDLMVGKLGRLPEDTQLALQQLACLGNVAGFKTLSTALGTSETALRAVLWEAIRQELVERLDDAYRFVHDRIHEAAYSLIPEDSRAEAHLRVGRLLTAQASAKERDEAIFEIVGQLNRGAALITDQAEREQLAQFNLIAGQRAKASTAYASALNYLSTGMQLLDEDCWTRRHELIFALALSRAECELLTGQLGVADECLTALSDRATTVIERASVTCLLMDVYLLLDRSDGAVAVCLAYLRHVGIEWSAHPTDAQVREEYERTGSLLGERAIEELIDLPLMDDPTSLMTLNALGKLFAPALQSDGNLADLLICKAVNLSLERGNCDASCVLYANFFRVAGRRFGDHQMGFRFGQLGCELVERRGLTRFEASTYLCFSCFAVRWMRPVGECRDLLRRSFAAANRIGDLPYGAYAGNNLVADLLFAGEPLDDVQGESERGLAYAKKVGFGLVTDFIVTQLTLIRMLRGETPTFGRLDDGELNESVTEAHLSSNPDLVLAECLYWVRKLQARYLADDAEEAVEAAAKAQQLLWVCQAFCEEAEYHFYSALARAARCDSVSVDEQAQHLIAMAVDHQWLEAWARQCPENFASRAALVGAEIARVEGRLIEAELLYEQALQAAQASGFIHVEALANELASRFYRARGFGKIARVYLQDARYGYLRWGADGKVRQLEDKYPALRAEELAPGPTTTMATPVEHLDLATVLKVSQAVSGEIVLEKLIDMIMTTAIEQAGAERGLLVLLQDGEQRVAAQVTAGGTTQLRNAPVSAVLVPESVLYHVLRTRESVVLDDALVEAAFATDPYIRQQRARSVLCLPLTNQAKLVGALYLENNLAAHVFSPGRIAVLKLVASQAAVSLENARLYREVAEREAKIRRLVDANIIGILVWHADGHIIEANDAFLRMLGYQREDLASGGLRWRDLTVPEFRELSDRSLAQALLTGHSRPYEKEYFRKDGSRLPVIVGLALFEAGSNEGVAFVLDLTERRQAEEKIRESERRYREVQTELAHANRVATMGQLVASIAHEVNQPIAAAILNANAALRWLNAQPPDIDEVRPVLERLILDANRAADVLGRIRGHIRKAPPQKGPVDINAAIEEMIEFTRGQIIKSGASIQTQLMDGLPLIEGDRVELQQVLLNLIMNALEAMGSVSAGERQLVIRATLGEANCVLVSVSDSGPGFASQSTDLVFTSFYTTKPTGLGLGLSICRSIIEAHGGCLSAIANPPRGATVQFTLPIARP
ncbi:MULTISPECIES: trifunctional serine/threonine-protein kinase/ATP-binding protein/sensor histidine kinase [unclassified Pseudomonas]|uniref:trifunctional serine/threonine-protein kinase/ATP-binding protein/sensor histidine kinase n=1 Tax=unclassified Pseudomonas TaxID=196821 RepID=UPI000595B321|nr:MULTISPECIES: trifunctional serine/threonine-protein kinase/ATP-binding protein/sensor histidine kinase [unclassified Pseudomonas]MBD0687736.1 protein kinase [Pseudomonas sp. PSB18]